MKNIFIILVASVFLSGCTTSSLYNPEQLFHEPKKTITVHTIDGRILRFFKGKYTVSQENGGQISGKGRLIINDFSNVYKDWEGTIGFSEIKSLAITETSTAEKVILYSILGTVSLILLIGLTVDFSMH